MSLSWRRLPYLMGRAKFKLSNHLRSMAAVHSTHKHVLGQMAEAAWIRLGPRRVKVSEYLEQALYNREIYPHSTLSSFGGWWFKEKIHYQLNNIRWEGMVTDKLMAYALFRQFGLPHPRVRAVAWARARNCGDIPVFHTPEDTAGFLREAGDLYPLFCKPVKGSFGHGAAIIEGYEKDGEQLRFSDGSRRGILEYLHSLQDDGWGYLFQDMTLPAPETLPVCGDRISGLRVVMLLGDDRACAYKVVWKIPARKGVTDNFHDGGSIGAAVDVATGRVLRTVFGQGINMKLNQTHPETGCELVGMKVPGWDAVMELMPRAATCFPGFRWQHWDVGLSAGGPVLFELNSAGNTSVLQVSHGEGIWSERLKDFLGRYGGKTEPKHGSVF